MLDFRSCEVPEQVFSNFYYKIFDYKFFYSVIWETCQKGKQIIFDIARELSTIIFPSNEILCILHDFKTACVLEIVL